MVADIPERRARSRQRLVERTDGDRLAVGQAVFLEVAAIAGTIAVTAQPLVVVKLLAERNLFRGHSVVLRNLHLGVAFKLREGGLFRFGLFGCWDVAAHESDRRDQYRQSHRRHRTIFLPKGQHDVSPLRLLRRKTSRPEA